MSTPEARKQLPARKNPRDHAYKPRQDNYGSFEERPQHETCAECGQSWRAHTR